jgi:hypothetical protein
MPDTPVAPVIPVMPEIPVTPVMPVTPVGPAIVLYDTFPLVVSYVKTVVPVAPEIPDKTRLLVALTFRLLLESIEILPCCTGATILV